MLEKKSQSRMYTDILLSQSVNITLGIQNEISALLYLLLHCSQDATAGTNNSSSSKRSKMSVGMWRKFFSLPPTRERSFMQAVVTYRVQMKLRGRRERQL